MNATKKPVHVVRCRHGEETYLWVWHDGQRREVLRSVARFAANPDLNFDGLDAARVAQVVRKKCKE